jgi:uncharacterized protein
MPMLAIGLIDGPVLDETTLSLPACSRLTDFVNMQESWSDIGRHISDIRYSWGKPLMMSKIEEVPISDILQMIAIGRWNAMLQIQGRNVLSKTPGKRTVERMRGNIYFWNGEPLAAWSSLHEGVQAVCDLLSLKQGILKATRPLSPPPFRNIRMDMQDILMSYAVNLDESTKHPVSPSDHQNHTADTPAPDATKSMHSPDGEPPRSKNGTSRTAENEPEKNGERIKEALSEFLRIDGVTAAAVVGRDGFVLESVSKTQLDADAVGAAVANAVGASEMIGKTFKMGHIEQSLVEFETGKAIVTVKGDDIFVLITDAQAAIGSIRYAVKKGIDTLVKIL